MVAGEKAGGASPRVSTITAVSSSNCPASCDGAERRQKALHLAGIDIGRGERDAVGGIQRQPGAGRCPGRVSRDYLRARRRAPRPGPDRAAVTARLERALFRRRRRSARQRRGRAPGGLSAPVRARAFRRSPTRSRAVRRASRDVPPERQERHRHRWRDERPADIGHSRRRRRANYWRPSGCRRSRRRPHSD